jgi:hypothetical protein
MIKEKLVRLHIITTIEYTRIVTETRGLAARC